MDLGGSNKSGGPSRTVSVHLADKTFEIQAIDNNASLLLLSIKQVNDQLSTATNLRRQKSGLFSQLEKTMMDNTFANTKATLGCVTELIEPSHAYLNDVDGSGRSGTATSYALRDGPRLSVTLSQMNIAHQSLNTMVVLLCSRESSRRVAIDSRLEDFDLQVPPSYEESNFLTASRAKNLARMQKRASSRPSAASRNDNTTINSNASAQPANQAQHERRSWQGPPPALAELPAEREPAELPGSIPDRPPPRQPRPASSSVSSEPATAVELDAGYVPYRPGLMSRNMRASEPVIATEHDTARLQRAIIQPDTLKPPASSRSSSQEPRLHGRARSRKWLESQSNQAEI